MKVRRRTDRLYETIIASVIPASLPGERLDAAAPQTDLAAQRFLFILFLLRGRRARGGQEEGQGHADSIRHHYAPFKDSHWRHDEGAIIINASNGMEFLSKRRGDWFSSHGGQ